MDTFAISINGGEPTLHPNFWEILKYIDKLGMEIVLTTNGSTISEKELKKFQNLKNFSCIRFSLDSLNKEFYEWFRGRKGFFEKVIKNIKTATKFNYQVNILTTITRLNLNEIEKIFSFAEKNKVNAVNFFPMVPVGRGKLNENLVLSKKEFRKFLIKIVEIKKNSSTTKLLTDHPLIALLDINLSRSLRICPAGIISISITPTGEVFPCPYFPISCGNILKESLKKIWNNNTLLNKLRDDNFLSEKCKVCKFKDSCRGGCRALAFIEFGDINYEDPLCWL